MGQPQLADSGESALESLKSAIAAFGASEDEAQAVEPELRSRRRALAEQFLGLADEQARARFAGPDGECLRLIVHCGLRDLERDADDAELAARARLGLGAATPSVGVLLAAMLLFQALELPVEEDLRAVPDWLLPDYARFLLAMPRVFQRPGDADLYCERLSEAVAAIHRYVSHQPELPL